MNSISSFLFFLFTFFSVSCGSGGDCIVGKDSSDNCEALKTFQLADSSQNLTFTHHCSKEKPGYWSSYALFEYQDGNAGKAAAVGQIEVGFIRGIQKIKGLRLNLEKMQIQSFSSWANHKIALALQLVQLDNQQSFTGDFVTEYIEGQGTATIKNYQVSGRGDLEWERFIEPEQQKGQKALPKTLQEMPHIIFQDEGALVDEYQLFFLIENQDRGEVLSLKGPFIKNLRELLQIEQPESRVLGFFATINPFQEGGLWWWLGSAFRYKDCIYLRKQSKYEFNLLF